MTNISNIPPATTLQQANLQRDLWIDTAAQYARNADYFRDLIVKVGEMLGPDAYKSDDGSVQDSVLCVKVPELVQARLTPPAKELIMQAVARGWCSDANKNKVMDIDLALAITDEVMQILRPTV